MFYGITPKGLIKLIDELEADCFGDIDCRDNENSTIYKLLIGFK